MQGDLVASNLIWWDNPLCVAVISHFLGFFRARARFFFFISSVYLGSNNNLIFYCLLFLVMLIYIKCLIFKSIRVFVDHVSVLNRVHKEVIYFVRNSPVFVSIIDHGQFRKYIFAKLPMYEIEPKTRERFK